MSSVDFIPLLWPFLIGSVPITLLAGRLDSSGLYNTLAGMALVATAARLAVNWGQADDDTPRRLPPKLAAIGIGAALGLLKGVTGIGAVYLSPVLLLFRWASFRQTGAAAAAFVVVTSAVAIAANPASVRHLPGAFPIWILAVFLGGLVGSELSVRHFHRIAFRRVLAVALLLAAWTLLVP